MHRLLSLVGAVAALAGLLVLAAPPALAEGAAKLQGVVNVNTASADQLELLPGIGASRAKAVIAARESRGGFRKLDDLLEVKGIGAAGLDRMRPFVRLTGKTTAQLD